MFEVYNNYDIHQWVVFVLRWLCCGGAVRVWDRPWAARWSQDRDPPHARQQADTADSRRTLQTDDDLNYTHGQ